jgi:hypothetical protein
MERFIKAKNEMCNITPCKKFDEEGIEEAFRNEYIKNKYGHFRIVQYNNRNNMDYLFDGFFENRFNSLSCFVQKIIIKMMKFFKLFLSVQDHRRRLFIDKLLKLLSKRNWRYLTGYYVHNLLDKYKVNVVCLLRIDIVIRAFRNHFLIEVDTNHRTRFDLIQEVILKCCKSKSTPECLPKLIVSCYEQKWVEPALKKYGHLLD